MAMPPATMDQQYLELMKQLVELQQDDIMLRKQGLNGQPNTSQVRRPEQPLIGLDVTDSNWEFIH